MRTYKPCTHTFTRRYTCFGFGFPAAVFLYIDNHPKHLESRITSYYLCLAAGGGSSCSRQTVLPYPAFFVAFLVPFMVGIVFGIVWCVAMATGGIV